MRQARLQTVLAIATSCTLHGAAALPFLLHDAPAPLPIPVEAVEVTSMTASAVPTAAEEQPVQETVATAAPTTVASTPPPEAVQAEPPPPATTEATPPPEPVKAEPPPEVLQAAAPEAVRAEPPPEAVEAVAEELPLPPPVPPPPRPPPPRRVAERHPPPREVPRRPHREVVAASSAPSQPAPPQSAPAPAAPAPRAAVRPPPSYLGALLAALERHKEYPASARYRRVEGTAVLRFRLRGDGSVAGWRIERSAGDAELDAAVEAMIRRASPLPPPPAELGNGLLELVVPVRFTLR